MTKKAILALAIIISLTSCKDSNNKETENKDQPARTEQVAITPSVNDEPVLKYGHVFIGDCSATSIDWAGSYKGVIASVDNSKAQLNLTLNENWTYALNIMAIDNLQKGDSSKNLQYKGTFTFNKTGQIIKLLGTKHPLTNEMISVSVGENRVSVLGGDLKELSKDGDMNTLNKQTNQPQ